jgi:hypothetical protein
MSFKVKVFKDLAPTIEVGNNMTGFYGNEIKFNTIKCQKEAIKLIASFWQFTIMEFMLQF